MAASLTYNGSHVLENINAGNTGDSPSFLLVAQNAARTVRKGSYQHLKVARLLVTETGG